MSSSAILKDQRKAAHAAGRGAGLPWADLSAERERALTMLGLRARLWSADSPQSALVSVRASIRVDHSTLFLARPANGLHRLIPPCLSPSF
jgi:hypothetical protein